MTDETNNGPQKSPTIKNNDEATTVGVGAGDFRQVTKPGVNVNSDGPGRQPSKVTSRDLEWLGNLDDVSIDDFDRASEEGAGEFCVVLIDYVSGANGQGFVKGDVRRISKFISGYADPERLEECRMSAKRLFAQRAIRFADQEESQFTHIEVTAATETEAVQEERAKRIAAENENDNLRLQLEAALSSQRSVSPIPGIELGGATEAQSQIDDIPDFT